MKRTVLKKLAGCLAVIAILSFSVMQTSCSSEVEATVTKCYQPLRNGMVHTWIQVRFEDGTTAEIVLPDNDAEWSKGAQAAKNSRKARVRKSGEKWTFVSFN